MGGAGVRVELIKEMEVEDTRCTVIRPGAAREARRGLQAREQKGKCCRLTNWIKNLATRRNRGSFGNRQHVQFSGSSLE
jgi:hypothetical protein